MSAFFCVSERCASSITGTVDEGDEFRGKGSAELLDDGSLKIELAYHLGDDAVLKAVPS